MSLLDNRRLLEILPKCIEPYDKDNLENASYELRLGNEYFTTGTEEGVKTVINKGDQITIKPGQFALLITKEIVTIPSHLLAFISIKAKIKFCGLVNVSGFHVDPGFHGRLKFSVYNAGSRDIVLDAEQRLFPFWFLELTADLLPDNKYKGTHQNQESITSDDVRRIQGKILSPNALKEMIEELENKRIKDLEKNVGEVNIKRTIILTLLVSLLFVSINIFLNTYLNSDKVKQALIETKIDSLSKDENNQNNSITEIQRRLANVEKRLDSPASNSRAVK